MSAIKRFVADETGVTAIEYGLIATPVAVAIIAALNGLGSSLSNTFNKVSTALDNASK
jgi:pilus assembly protein Flp/PilA